MMQEVSDPPPWHPGPLTEGIFLRRLNRFVAEVETGGKRVLVHLPNTGRMGELLIPGVPVRMVPSGAKYPWRIVYFYYKGRPVLIDSIAGNAVFAALLEHDRVPGLEGTRVIKREPAWGTHRFDFILRDPDGSEVMTELKSCTLAWKNVASFPDAVSARAASHLRTLAEAEKGRLVFLNLHEGVTTFLPNYHTDFYFYETLKEFRHRLEIFSCSVIYDDDLAITGCRPMKVIIPEAEPKGAYLVIFENECDRKIDVGALGSLFFQKGFYIYAGSGRGNLFKRIEHHRRKKKRVHWHIDYISTVMKIRADMPVVTETVSECDMAGFLQREGGRGINRFGSSDCSCTSHLFYFEENPLQKTALWDWIFFCRYAEWQE